MVVKPGIGIQNSCRTFILGDSGLEWPKPQTPWPEQGQERRTPSGSFQSKPFCIYTPLYFFSPIRFCICLLLLSCSCLPFAGHLNYFPVVIYVCFLSSLDYNWMLTNFVLCKQDSQDGNITVRYLKNILYEFRDTEFASPLVTNDYIHISVIIEVFFQFTIVCHMEIIGVICFL